MLPNENKTAEDYKKLLKQHRNIGFGRTFSDELIEEEFKGMPSDSRRGNVAASRVMSKATDKAGNKVFAEGTDTDRLVKGLGHSPVANIFGLGSASHLSRLQARDAKLEQGKFSFLPGDKHGYGMGFKGSVSASSGVHAANIAKHLSVGGMDALANSFGFLTPTQKTQARTGGMLTKAMTASIPIGTAGFSLFQMANDEDAGDILATNLSFATGVTGFRVGKSIGGALTSKGATMSRLAGMGLGGVTGFAAGMMATQGAYEAAKDLTSNQSNIALLARSSYTRSHMAHIKDTQESLTMRSRTLQKLSSSGLNDRGTLLGNEAMIIKNLM